MFGGYGLHLISSFFRAVQLDRSGFITQEHLFSGYEIASLVRISHKDRVKT
jgi:hypothetical protein